MHSDVTIDWTIVLGEHYASACRVVNRCMPPGLRGRYDPEDFVGDAIVELLKNPARLAEYQPHLLIVIAKRRMIDAARSAWNRLGRLEVELIDLQASAALHLEAAEMREEMLGRAGCAHGRAMLEFVAGAIQIVKSPG